MGRGVSACGPATASSRTKAVGWWAQVTRPWRRRISSPNKHPGGLLIVGYLRRRRSCRIGPSGTPRSSSSDVALRGPAMCRTVAVTGGPSVDTVAGARRTVSLESLSSPSARANTRLVAGQLDMDPRGYIVTQPGTTLTSVRGLRLRDVQDRLTGSRGRPPDGLHGSHRRRALPRVPARVRRGGDGRGGAPSRDPQAERSPRRKTADRRRGPERQAVSPPPSAVTPPLASRSRAATAGGVQLQEQEATDDRREASARPAAIHHDDCRTGWAGARGESTQRSAGVGGEPLDPVGADEAVALDQQLRRRVLPR